MTCRIYLLIQRHKIDLGVDFTIFEAEELENKEMIHVELMHELDSDFRDLFHQVTEITTSQSLFMPCVRSVYNFLIFVFLGLENDKIGTKIVFNCVTCIEEMKQIMEFVTSQSLARSRVNGTSFPSLFSSSSTSNMVKLTPRSILCHLY